MSHWPKSDDREYHSEKDIPPELIEEIRKDISDDDWNYFIKNDSAVIKRHQVIDMRTNLSTLTDLGWALFLIIR